MDTTEKPVAGKERALTRKTGRPVRDALVDPRTWRAALGVLEFVSRLIKLGAKIWDMFG